MIDNTFVSSIEILKKEWIGKICQGVNYPSRHRQLSDNSFIVTVSQDIYTINDAKTIEKMVASGIKNKFGRWYTGSLSKHEILPPSDTVLVVDVIRDVQTSRLPKWSAIVLYKEQYWLIPLKQLMIYQKD
jgi:hypothetical protein